MRRIAAIETMHVSTYRSVTHRSERTTAFDTIAHMLPAGSQSPGGACRPDQFA